MVFEDDAKFLGGYEKLWNTQFINAMPLDADLVHKIYDQYFT